MYFGKVIVEVRKSRGMVLVVRSFPGRIILEHPFMYVRGRKKGGEKATNQDLFWHEAR